MKEEDLDWWIYHLLAEEPGQDLDGLSHKTGCGTTAVTASLRRLAMAFLVEQEGETWRTRSVQEVLLSCQAKYDESLPFVIEHGVVRERQRPG